MRCSSACFESLDARIGWPVDYETPATTEQGQPDFPQTLLAKSAPTTPCSWTSNPCISSILLRLSNSSGSTRWPTPSLIDTISVNGVFDNDRHNSGNDMSEITLFLERLQCWGTQSCIDADGTSHAYLELLEELDRWSARFEALEVGAGSVIGIRADFSIYGVSALLALLSRSAVAALIPRDRNTDRYLDDSFCEGLLSVAIDGSYEYQRIPRISRAPLLEQLRVSGDGGLVVFTSGSTGRPKAALHSADRFLQKFRKPGRRFRTLAFLLFDHIAGLDTLLYTLASGGTLVIPRRRDPNAIMELIESRVVEVLPTSPSFLRLLCAAGGDRAYDLSSLKVITYGSEPMDSSTLERMNMRFPNIQISQKYGTTELGSPKSVSRGNDSLWLKIKSDDIRIKVVDGVLWILSPSAILGYLNAPSPLDDNGWYCTGDLVDVDGEWVRFRGRMSDIINVGGEKVSPAEVEQTIMELEFVRDVVVSGEPHTLMGQIVTARITLSDDAMNVKEATSAIRAHCRKHHPAFKVPVKIAITTEQFANHRHKVSRQTQVSGDS